MVKTKQLVAEVKKYFPDAKLENSTEFKNWKEIARKYKGVKITFDRKWISETDNEN